MISKLTSYILAGNLEYNTQNVKKCNAGGGGNL